MSVKRAPSDLSSVRHRPAVMWIGVLTLLLSLFTPMITLEIADAASAAAELAQGVPPDCEEGYEPNAEETECIPIGEGQNNLQPECDPGFIYNEQSGQCEPEQPQCDSGFIYDQQSGQCVPEQPDCEPGTIYNEQTGQCEPETQPVSVELTKWECGPEANQYLQDYDYLTLNCDEAESPYTFWHGGPDGQTDPVAVQGYWEWTDLTPGQHWIGEQPSEQYVATVFCRVFDPGTGQNQSQHHTPDGGGQIYLDIPSGGIAHCEWYNILAGDDYGRLILHKYYCPEYWDFDPTSSEFSQLDSYCTTPGPSVTFDYEHNGAPVQQLTTDDAGYAEWGEAPTGNITIREQQPIDYAFGVVFCYYHLDGEINSQGPPQAVQMQDATSFNWNLEPGYVLECWFYNFPTDQLQLYKYWCHPDYVAPEGATYTDYQNTCNAQPAEQVSWRVAATNGDQEITTLQASSDVPGYASYHQLPQDEEISITEQLPADSNYTAVWYCFEYQRGNPNQPSATYTYDPNTGPTWTPREGYYLVCLFFNVYSDVEDAGGGNTVTLYKWQCVEGTEYGRELAYYQGGLPEQDTGPCETEHLNVPVNLIHGGPQQDTTTQANGTQFNNVVLDNGSFQIAIDEPEGYGDPMVWCWPVDGDPPATPIAAPGGTFTVTPGSEPFSWQCVAYDILADGNSVTVYKWDCEPGTEYGRELAYYQGGLPEQDTGPCETEHLNIPISLIHGGPQQDTTTQANGTQFNNVVLDNGSFQIAIDEPEGYGDPMVWCWPVDGDPPANPISAPGGTFTVTPDAEPFSWQCLVYNIQDDDYNYIDFWKYVCDFDAPKDQDKSYYEQNCDVVEGWEFNVQWNGGGSTQSTDENGHAGWSGVPTGSWQGSESVPEGYGEPLVWCRWVDWPDEAGYNGDWSPYTLSQGAIEGSFDYENSHIECHWYNFGQGEYHLELYKYLCGPTVDRNLGLPDYGTMCDPAQGISFTVKFGDQPASAYYTDANGYIDWPDVPGGQWWLEETAMPGWGAPKVYCGPPQVSETPEVTVTNLTVSGTLNAQTPHLICFWVNFEEPYDNGNITLHKYQCPPETTTTDLEILRESCTQPHNGVGFTLNGPSGSVSASTVGGTIDWLNLDQGTYTITEALWPGYAPPLVWCGYVMQDGADIDPSNWEFASYPVTDNSFQLELNNFPARIVCEIYNVPPGYGEITLYKWLCPPGYDIEAWGADPAVDCTEAWNGITFTLDQPQGDDLVTATGDSIPGAAYFGGLNPGAYTVTETVPPDIDHVFVLDCTGTDIPKVHQYPLSWGNKLDINVAGGDSIVCHWYNVPEPEDGWVTVYKYQCWTSKFVSAVDCEIYEYGATFELYGMPGNTSYGTGTTNNGGLYTWNGLPEGAYTIDEISHKPCKITSTKVDGQGNAWVDAGQGTIIKVYNCKSSSTTTPTPGTTPTPKTPGKVPGKYPNTGIDPAAVDEFMPALQETPVGTPPPLENDAPEDDYYRISCLEGTPAATATATETTEPVASPTVTATPEEFDLPIDEEDLSTPTTDGTPGAEEDCARGALPERVVIEAANVDAGVETLEIVDGLMEQPTGPTLVTWYKETGRLGELNNIVIAGHLNWWNMPEGVFYRLQDLQEGDRVEITGDDGMTYIFEIQWVRQESNLEPPAADVIGPTDEQSLTLITCGGPWNADIAEYEERTVARAVQVDVVPAETDDDTAWSPMLAA